MIYILSMTKCNFNFEYVKKDFLGGHIRGTGYFLYSIIPDSRRT